MTSVVVFDYGFGNVRSMVRALANLDLDVTLTSDHRQALEADGLVVPGVGAFGACMEGLKSVGGDTVIKDRLRAGRPVLGVCVGEQIMFERGMEHGTGTPGLGLIKGDVELLDADVVPHMGWDTVEAPEGSVLMKGVENERFYFVHSFAAMSAAARGKFQGYGEVGFGALHGIRYIDGDCICMCFPVPGDEYSYLLVTVVKAEGNDDTLDELQDDENLAALLGSVEISAEK